MLSRRPGLGGWVFAVVPQEHAPEIAGSFGRVPVNAVVDDQSWQTSVWLDKSGIWMLAVPRAIRGEKDDGDVVSVAIDVDYSRLPRHRRA